MTCKAGAKTAISSAGAVVSCPAASQCKYSSCGSTCSAFDHNYACQVTSIAANAANATSQCSCGSLDGPLGE